MLNVLGQRRNSSFNRWCVCFAGPNAPTTLRIIACFLLLAASMHSILNLAFYLKCGKLPMVFHRLRRIPEQARAVAKSFFAAFGGREGGERIGGTAPGPPVKGLAALCNPAFRQACIDTQKYVTRELASNRMNREHTHTYQVAISPDLNITAEEFARAWNAGHDTHNLATAHSVEEKASQFMDPTLLIGALLSIPAGVTTMEIYDLIKSVIERLRKEKGQVQASQSPQSPQGPRKHLHMEQTRKPDGSTIIIVDYEEA